MDFSLLNGPQKEAVETLNGPLQILAGAGSGKTRVITYRIANLINHGVMPSQIMALTFTNKAASEMKARLGALLNNNISHMWIGTFHSMCLRILRSEIESLGYDSNFVIYDSYDQLTLLKECMKEAKVNTDIMKPAYFSSIISSAKDELITPDEYENKFALDIKTKTAAKVYKLYQKRLKSSNAVDFDDIIVLTIKVLKNNSNTLEYYREKFTHILVDEYQDSNHAQYVLVNLLASKYKNLCVVGDDDQSIYGWRGADIRNILEFEKDYPESKIIKLEQNYRSTDIIVAGANAVISKNSGRKRKKLWTEKSSDKKIEIKKNYSDKDESNFISGEIHTKVARAEYNYRDFAILYRTNAQSRNLEESLVRRNIPYNIYGGLKFYDRKEIKDIMAYLKLISNPVDSVALKRIINVPKRGIGARTIEKFEEKATITGEAIYSAMLDFEQVDISARTKNSIRGFLMTINSIRSMTDILVPSEVIAKILENTNYMSEYEDDGEIEYQTRFENIQELISVAQEFEKANEVKTISNFLSTISLSSDIDKLETEENVVTLMTLHSAKGLEFPVVFMSGLEEGVFPLSRSTTDENQLEEERRLCYVGMTRAEEKLYMTYATERTIFGKTTNQRMSRFLQDIPTELLNGKVEQRENSNSGYSMLDKYAQKFKLERAEVVSPKENAKNIPSFDIATEIKHPVFGKGKIVAKKDSVYTIVFEGIGLKKIDIAYVKIEKA